MPLIQKPILGPCRVDLRPYQIEAIDAVRDEYLKGVNSTMVCIATGLGKTVVAAMVARKMLEKGTDAKPNRILFLAHTDELIDQTVAKFDMLGVEVGVEKASRHARQLFDPDAVVACVPTLKPKRLATWPKDHFKLICVDECHHATSDSYQRILKHFDGARVLGMTATADRHDGRGLGEVFETVAYEMDLWDGMTAPDPGPYLSRLKYVQCDVDIDLRDLRMKDEDFTDADLEARIGPMVELLANSIKKEAGDRRTLIFTPQVKSSMAMATALQSIGVRAEWIAGDDPNRKSKIDRFRTGDIQMLANCSVLLEGFDVPETSAIALCRPTKSRPLHSQICGRGVRLADGKESCVLIDFNFMTAEHDLVRAVDLCGTKRAPKSVLDEAQQMLKDDKGLDLTLAIERATKAHKEREVLSIKARERELHYRRVSYDPLTVFEAMGIPWRAKRSNDAKVTPATPSQIAALQKFKVENPESLSKTSATTMLDFLIPRAKEGLASHRQVGCLISNGIDPERARNMTFVEASSFISSLRQKRA